MNSNVPSLSGNASHLPCFLRPPDVAEGHDHGRVITAPLVPGALGSLKAGREPPGRSGTKAASVCPTLWEDTELCDRPPSRRRRVPSSPLASLRRQVPPHPRAVKAQRCSSPASFPGPLPAHFAALLSVSFVGWELSGRWHCLTSPPTPRHTIITQ